ncbi:hypothetical protein GIB67_024828 [Kingdonia uniflora]|uniref:ABC transporter domain-containing protein n=1 Tax=Kingdonia uniflora TaxID=39325 RepID=A0A7J7NYD1_9MAGN|nr:hypothetical protein GIB67_024828 [Kingdonia uniflora]
MQTITVVLLHGFLNSDVLERLGWPLGPRKSPSRLLSLLVYKINYLAIVSRYPIVFPTEVNKVADAYHNYIFVSLVGVKLPTVEVRYKNLCVGAVCEVVDGKPLPTLWHSFRSKFSVLTKIFCCTAQEAKIHILTDVSGIIKPARMTLLLGPPGCGKTTLLLVLTGKLNPSIKTEGEISYNGYGLDKFVPQKTSAYISQHDLHISEMTVRETLDFSGRCQGVGNRAGTHISFSNLISYNKVISLLSLRPCEEMMREVSKREKQAGIHPEPDIDTYMKAISVKGLERTLQTDYILKILGLDICADTIVGDAMKRGLSGGQKKRVTTGEMIIGPTRALFMDEITNGLDTSTTFQIITCLQQLVHIMESTMLVSLLQPAPETFDLFDDVILMAEGKIIYHGPRSYILEFFENCGFKCPERKGVADFLQEVISRKDQAQYWNRTDLPHSYVSVDQFIRSFKACHVGKNLVQELSSPNSKSESQKDEIFFSAYSLSKWELFKACMAREWLLMKRNSFIHIFKSAQLVAIALISMTVFIRTNADFDLQHANYYVGSLFYALLRLLSNGIAELSLTVSRLAVFYKQRDFCFYPAWAYSVPATILKIPFSFIDSLIWTALTYYVIGYSPELERFFFQFLLLFALHQVATSFFRFLASICRNPVVATALGTFSLLLICLFGGFILPQPSLPDWLQWGFWISPLTYAAIGMSVNEFLAPRWNNASYSNTTVGQQILINRGVNYEAYFYWISLGALFGFYLAFNVGFILALTYLKPPGTSRAIISREKLARLECKEGVSRTDQDNQSSFTDSTTTSALKRDTGVKLDIKYGVVHSSGRMVLPFEPLTVAFSGVQYFVETPKKMKEQGFAETKLHLLRDITGAFRPGILTALMGVSGAGKTTLMDVLSGRKTGGIIEGEIRIGGYPKNQDTYARISGYCEQTDIQSPQITVEESVIYSAWLRLPPQIDANTKSAFVKEVLELIELDEIKDDLVGIPGVSGISTEQRKRLTIAVELVSNPSIIFMDEPTSGLDARAASVVMRAVKNIASTRRTIVCTIHQPSIDIFEAFDELILMKRGGQMIYSGPVGQHSHKLIEYFEGIPGVPKIKDNYNPATWMLEITAPSVESRLGLNFADIYKESPLYWENKELVKVLSVPTPGSRDLHFPTQFPRNGWDQFKSCLWKQKLSYWRSPQYNLVRLSFMTSSSVLFGTLLWQKGKKINNEQDLFNVLGSIFILTQFTGINNCTSVLPFVARERTVLYRERFAGMYSSWAYSFAQVTIEIPYIFLQTILCVGITYPAIGYYLSIYKVFWYFYVIFCTLLYFNYLGMMLIAWTSTVQVATVWASFCYTMLNLFSGFLIPQPQIPKWWVWAYWVCPNAWSLKGILTSQYGDVNKEIMIFGERKAISSFLEDYFGYDHDKLYVAAIVLLGFPFAFASLFAIGIAKLNFQKR